MDLNNLNASLHSIISGERNDANIPYADDDKATDDNKSSDSISSNDSYKQRAVANYRRGVSERRGANLRLLTTNHNGTGNEASDETDSSESLRMEQRDKPGPLYTETNSETSNNLGVMRRNSISMPVLNQNDLDALRELHMKTVDSGGEMNSNEDLDKVTVIDDSESMVCSIAEAEAESEKESEMEPMMKSRASKFRTKRRHSIAPLPAIRLNDKEIMVNAEYDAQSVNSAAPSITSISSLASLLREKMQSLPAKIRKRKKSKDYKIRAFVALLFLAIVFLVGYAYVMYNQKVMSRMYFENIKFSSTERSISINDAKGNSVLNGHLALAMGLSKPYKCRDKIDKNTNCWEWTGHTKLFVSLDDKFNGESADNSPTARCYNFRWETLREGYTPIDCFNIGEDLGQWYGGGITKDTDWLLDAGSWSFSPFVTGDTTRTHQWGNAIKRYFINSLGVAIEVDESTPLHISVNTEYKSKFCLKAQYDNFAYVNRPTPLPELKYRVCTASDMKVLHHNLTQKNLWDGLKMNDVNVMKTLFNEPVWEVSGNLSDVRISNFTDEVIALGYFRLGHVLISEQWQRNIGDFEIDEERFMQLNDTINVLHRRGFRISLTINPFVSTESANFVKLLEKKLLIYERSTGRTIPALTKFRDSSNVGVIDPTNNETIPWLIQKLEKTVKKYSIDSFYLEFMSAYDMPRFYQCAQPLLNPDHYKTIFLTRTSEVLNLLGASSAISTPHPPSFLSLPKVNSSWEGLQRVITSALNYGIIGYPFIMPGAIGGDFFTDKDGNLIHHDNTLLPERELYIRWLQLATFLPVMKFINLPSDYKDDHVTEIAKELAAIRQKTVAPMLGNYLNDAMNDGLPLIRPLWMLDPNDAACLNVVDEFSVGEQIIVAPILKPKTTIREVYLPRGVWKDGVDGSMRKGSRWIHNYRVPEDKIAYFVKMPDDTKF